ncbi:phosphonate ABC transporter ATP-binding protein [Rhodococcus wratislaviensis]|uniref:phosphonate ABC transporter ATP-binding protein n=1 Tax=Rhodococcus wratislaviensis TaxID=44752 RepID=UPI00351755CE
MTRATGSRPDVVAGSLDNLRVNGHRRDERGAAITVRDLAKQFGSNNVLHSIDLEVGRGEFVALLGPSGSGKSTLLRMLNGTLRPSKGTVEILGTDPATCSRSDLRAVRTRVGFVFQQFGLIGRMSAMENVLMGALGQLRLPRYGIATYPKDLRLRAVEKLDRVGLVDYRFQRCDTLSGGQQQRVAIARSLMQQPSVILADEPVASLDPVTSERVLAILRRISTEDDLTVVCSLHQTELALQSADRIVALSDGGIVLDSATQGLTTDDLHTIYAPRAAS